MAKIQLLEKSVAELIAAGEVIERPASVIKEIVENAVDAGASRITVEIKNGGVTYMRVTDNGCGIAFDEVPTAFLRHATSKLCSAEDLDDIRTMGFRGEALASVAAVAQVEVLTKRAEDELGVSYGISGGVEIRHEHTGCPDGTTVIVRDLFFNTPARLKFMKKDVTEGNYVQSVVDKLALAHPQISFSFIRDNKQVRLTSGDGDYYSAIYAVFGKQFAASLIPVDFAQNGITVTGYISAPYFCRANRAMQYFFVNARSIRNTTCMAALEEGYRNSTMTGKFPACVLNITLPPSEMDVNVSPSKTEVRFSNERCIFDAIYMAVKNGILNADNSKEIQLPKAKPVQTESKASERIKPSEGVQTVKADAEPVLVVSERKLNSISPCKNKQEPIMASQTPSSTFSGGSRPLFFSASKAVYRPEPSERVYAQQKLEPVAKETDTDKYRYISKESLMVQSLQEKPKCEPAPIEEEAEEKPFTYVGELFRTYILCEHDDKLIMIDKHAAHERLRFEEIKNTFTAHAQLLADAVKVSLSAEECAVLSDNSELLSDIGIELIINEDSTAEVLSLPSILEGKSPEEIVQKLAHLLMKNNQNAAGELFDDILHTFACKGAIKAHYNNTPFELEQLAKRIWEDESIRYCPHGRPIITTLSKYNIEKNFKRIQ